MCDETGEKMRDTVEIEGKGKKKLGIKSSFILRLILFCMITSFSVVILLSAVLSAYVSIIMRDDAIGESRQSLVAMNGFFEEKMNAVKRFHYGMYQDVNIRCAVQTFFAGSNTPGEDIDIIRQCSEMLNSRYGYADNVLSGVSLYGLEYGRQAELLQTGGFHHREAAMQKMLADAKEKSEANISENRIFYSVYLALGEDDGLPDGTLSIYDFIREPGNLTHIIGILAFHYDLNKISGELKGVPGEKSRRILVLSDKDEVLYSLDMNYEWALVDGGNGFREMGQYHSMGAKIYESPQYLMGVTENERFGFRVVCLTDKKQLYSRIRSLNVFTFSMMGAALVVVSILVLLFSRRISRRITIIMDGIGSIKQGDMYTRIPTTPKEDELDLIAHSLTEMCRSLREKAAMQQQAERQRNEAVLCQKDAEIYALQAQINPHFLFNMLEVARMKAVVDGCMDTALMVKILSDIFRESVGRGTVAAIGEEIECCMLYVRLFEIRRESSISVKLDVCQEIRKSRIPTHILLPIVENALVHGLAEENAVISISAHREGDDILFVIQDNGPGLTDKQLEDLNLQIENYTSREKNIGLANVNKRLKLIYGSKYGVRIQSRPGEGLTVQLAIGTDGKGPGKDYV